MNTVKKILIVLDVYHDFRDDPQHQPVETRKAIDFIGNRKEAQIYLVGCGFEEFLHDNYANYGPQAIDQRKQFLAEMEERLAVFATALKDKGYNVDCRVHWTYPRYEQIANEAIDLDVDLVVQHVHAQRAIERHNLSHDSWQLIKFCQKPLLLVKDQEWPEQPTIVAAVDPIHSQHKPLGLDYKIMDTALSAKQSLGGNCHVLHAYSEKARAFFGDGLLKEDHSKALQGLLANYKLPAESIHLIDETPAKAILQCRKSFNADVVVLGALSRSRLSEQIIGNTANRVLDYVQSDLFIVRAE